jgi:hypothetical protein
MGHLPLLHPLLAAGTLVKPFAQASSLNRSLSLLLPAHSQSSAWVDALKI